MDSLTLARIAHVFAVVVWIGGVCFVTTVLLPTARRADSPDDGMKMFQRVERRFSMQARIMILLAGLSGLYMLDRLDAWDRLSSATYWWMHAMIGVWALFTVILFIVEPLVLDRWLAARAVVAPEATLRLLERLHWVLLSLSIVTLLGATAGAHGVLAFE